MAGCEGRLWPCAACRLPRGSGPIARTRGLCRCCSQFAAPRQQRRRACDTPRRRQQQKQPRQQKQQTATTTTATTTPAQSDAGSASDLPLKVLLHGTSQTRALSGKCACIEQFGCRCSPPSPNTRTPTPQIPAVGSSCTWRDNELPQFNVTVQGECGTQAKHDSSPVLVFWRPSWL